MKSNPSLEPFQSAENVKKNVDCMYPTSYFGYQIVETASVSALGSYDARLLASVAKEVLKNRGDWSKRRDRRAFRTVFAKSNGERIAIRTVYGYRS